MRTWVVALMLALTILSGCAETDGADAVTPDETDAEPTDAAEETNQTDVPGEAPADNATANVTNEAPVLDATLSNDTVEAGGVVAITIDGSDDGDNLTWTVLIDGAEAANGTELPSTYEHTFEAVGTYTINVTLSDDVQNATAGFVVTVVEADPCNGEERCILWEDDEMEFWSDGICEAKEEFGHDAGGWAYVPYTTVEGVTIPGGLWIYEETNGLPGLQLHKDEGGNRADCVNGDAIIF